jgi:hypothetical protein
VERRERAGASTTPHRPRSPTAQGRQHAELFDDESVHPRGAELVPAVEVGRVADTGVLLDVDRERLEGVLDGQVVGTFRDRCRFW